MNRSTSTLIKIINNFKPFNEDNSVDDHESFFYDITDELYANADGKIAISAVIKLIERYPNADFGSPGPLVHWLEKYPHQYESILYDSIKKCPVPLTIWMLNRIINAERDNLHYAILINLLTEVSEKEHVHQSAKDMAVQCLAYQNTVRDKFSTK
ncbi:hypothetical protein [Mucilaginibacter sp. CSA2-8R]|uniref:hypothetical protein n=1 Tax=Mucilaginibacter sp. CSA2-8R TaxID=3141542 RepID=UPI00315CC33A